MSKGIYIGSCIDSHKFKLTIVPFLCNSSSYNSTYSSETDSFTSITYLGYPIKLYNIKTGDLVKIKANETSTDRADDIQLMSKRQRVEKIYKARILNTLPTQNRIALSKVQSYKYPDWMELDDEKTFPIKRDAEIYKEGRRLTIEDVN
jgi:hypothetical protein